MIIKSSDSPLRKSVILGERLKQARLNLDLSQIELSEKSGVSRRSIINAEKGKVSLVDLIALLDALGVKNGVDTLLPSQPISPMQLLKLKGRVRKKASGGNKAEPANQIKVAKVVEW